MYCHAYWKLNDILCGTKNGFFWDYPESFWALFAHHCFSISRQIIVMCHGKVAYVNGRWFYCLLMAVFRFVYCSVGWLFDGLFLKTRGHTFPFKCFFASYVVGSLGVYRLGKLASLNLIEFAHMPFARQNHTFYGGGEDWTGPNRLKQNWYSHKYQIFLPFYKDFFY